MREERDHKAKVRQLELEEEEAREKRIKQLQRIARGDAAADERHLKGELVDGEEEEKENTDAAGNQNKVPYLPPHDPSFLI